MFEDMTFERILTRCLSRVPQTVDKREGAIIYDAIAPAAAELAILYSTLSTEMDRAFPDTATGIDLTNKAKERSIFRLAATKAVRKGVFQNSAGFMDIPVGTRFSGGTVNYTATARISQGVYQMTCEDAGIIGNAYFGTLIPIDYVSGLASATLEDILIPGEDEEDDDTLRARYMESLNSTAFGGNIAQYKEMTEKIPGVGSVKVFPVWNGGGTVKLVILGSDGGVPSSTLVNAVQTAIDPEVNQGEGIGLAPIGHVVTVEAATGTAINVAFTLTLETGVAYSAISEQVKAALQAYYDGLIDSWADASSLVVRISQIESRILDVPGVVDITGTTINGSAENLVLSSVAIPIMGTVTNNAV